MRHILPKKLPNVTKKATKYLAISAKRALRGVLKLENCSKANVQILRFHEKV